MASPLELEIPFEVYLDEPPKMIHLQDDVKGFPHAMCGKVCEEDLGYIDDELVDCVVCWAMGEAE